MCNRYVSPEEAEVERYWGLTARRAQPGRQRHEVHRPHPGRPQLKWDGPLGLNDLAYVSVNLDLFSHSGQGTSGQTACCIIP